MLKSIVFSGFLVLQNVCMSRQTTVISPCPDGYNYQFNETCYLLSHDKEPWINAMMSCQILGGNLVEVESNGEATFLKSICKGKGEIRWIALTTKRAPASWEWATSHRKLTDTPFADWANGEPDNYNHDSAHDESCVAMDGDPVLSHQYAWADLECFRKELYICEAQPAPILPFFGRK